MFSKRAPPGVTRCAATSKTRYRAARASRRAYAGFSKWPHSPARTDKTGSVGATCASARFDAVNFTVLNYGKKGCARFKTCDYQLHTSSIEPLEARGKVNDRNRLCPDQ
jgi:hypothetical protein